MKIQLNPEQTEREIADTGQLVEPGGVVDVPKKLADRLLEQTDVWSKPTSNDSEDG